MVCPGLYCGSKQLVAKSVLVAFFQVEMMATVAESVDYLSEAILNKCKRDQC